MDKENVAKLIPQDQAILEIKTPEALVQFQARQQTKIQLAGSAGKGR